MQYIYYIIATLHFIYILLFIVYLYIIFYMIYIYIYTSYYLYISIFKTKIKSLSSIAGTRIISTSKKLNKNLICCPV